MYRITILYAMKNIGLQDIELLRPHEQFFESCKDEAVTRDMAQSCIDTLEGRR